MESLKQCRNRMIVVEHPDKSKRRAEIVLNDLGESNNNLSDNLDRLGVGGAWKEPYFTEQDMKDAHKYNGCILHPKKLEVTC